MKSLNTAGAAAYIGKSASWLNKTRLTGTGPTYVKLGATVRYFPADLDQWIAAHRRTAVYDFANDNSVATARAAA